MNVNILSPLSHWCVSKIYLNILDYPLNVREFSNVIHVSVTKNLIECLLLIHQTSPISDYKRIWNRIADFASQGYSVLSTSGNRHEQMVLEGQYAYISDITACQTILSKSCDIHIMEEMFFPNMYGIGMQNNSAYRSTFDEL